MYVATSQQLKRYDQALLEEDYTIEELVDKASDVLLRHFLKYQKIMIVCGPGNNGADGLSLALKLKDLDKDVRLYLIGPQERLSKANQYYYQQGLLCHLDMIWLDQQTLVDFEDDLNRYDVVVDALFGFGLNSDLRGMAKNIVDCINQAYQIDVVAIDIPTGLNPDTGKPYQTCLCASHTITLTAYKQAFLNEETQIYTGDITLETLDTKDLRDELNFAKIVDETWAKYHLQPRVYDGHKGTYGRVLMITGCDHYRGAALLSAKAAVYSGSGIVTVCSSEKVIDALAHTCLECTSLERDQLNLHSFEQKNAVLIGSGLGLSKESEQLVEATLMSSDLPLVIDGDALTILSRHLELFGDDKTFILTPHIGEFARFVSFKDEAEMIEKAIQFAHDNHIILVLKGPHTFISDGQDSYRIASGHKAMASAGMGDVLAGMITSFVGQGYKPLDAAILATYIHGRCGENLAATQYSALAHQVIEEIPQMMFSIQK